MGPGAYGIKVEDFVWVPFVRRLGARIEALGFFLDLASSVAPAPRGRGGGGVSCDQNVEI